MIQLSIEDRAPWTEKFCKHWLEKANDYDFQSVNSAFDKFFSLFVTYNMLYSYMALTLQNPKNPNGDKDKATKHFAEAVGYQRIWDAVSNGDGLADIDRLRTLIADGGKFFLFIEKGTLGFEPDKDENTRLYNDLASANIEVKVVAILEYIYQVRCNIFHGNKTLHEEQLEIVQPSTQCLERVVRLGLDVLSQHLIKKDRGVR